MLKAQDLALVATSLHIPLVVSDILGGRLALTDDVQFAIHDAMSDMNPDAALLCVALSVRKIAGGMGGSCVTLQLLDTECGRIIGDYAELWLRHAAGDAVDETEALDALCATAEDLEGLAEMIEGSEAQIRRRHHDAAELMAILSVQARAQALIAETCLEALEMPEEALLPAACNVIAFPARDISA